MNKHQIIQKQKQNMILFTLKAIWDDERIEEKGVDEEKIVAQVCLEYGAGTRYVKEIVKNMVLAGLISRNNKKLYYRPTKANKEVLDDI